MYPGKYLYFVVGISAGVALMFGVSHWSGSNNAGGENDQALAVEATPAAVESPFAVQGELPAVQPLTATAPESDDEDLLPDTAELIQRIEAAENRIESLEIELAQVQSSEFLPSGEPVEIDQTELLTSAFEPATVSEIETIRNDAQLQRLELRDRAIREGWINTDRFRDERRALSSGIQIRDALGDENYDKLLAAEGRNNRVRIESVIENSAADFAGIQVGDLVVRYADVRIFDFRDLQAATTEGERDQPVNIQISRNSDLIDLVIPRGPLGVTLAGVTEQSSP